MLLSELRLLHLAGASPFEPGVAGHLLPDLLQALFFDIPKAQGHIGAGQSLAVSIHMNPPASGKASEHLRALQIGQSRDPGAGAARSILLLMEALQPRHIVCVQHLILMSSPSPHRHDLVKGKLMGPRFEASEKASSR